MPSAPAPDMDHAPFLLFDFDSTLVEVEALDELYRSALEEAGASSPEALHRFRALTDAGMEGALGHEASLAARLALFPGGGPTAVQVARTGEAVAGALSASVRRNPEFFARNRHRIHVVSGGFSELIRPSAAALGLHPHQVTAHAFRERGKVLELDPDTPMGRGGKTGAVRELLASGALPPHRPLWIVGDGATDLELRTAGLAERFVAYVEHVTRAPVVAAADHVVDSLETLLTLLDPNAPTPSPPSDPVSPHDHR